MSNLQNLVVEDLGLLAESPDLFVPIGTTTTVPVGTREKIPFTGKVGDTVFDYFWEVHSARLTRLTHIINSRIGSDGQPETYNLVTGVFSRVEATLTVVYDGEEISLEQWLCNVTNAAISDETKKIPVEVFTKQLSNMGFKWGTESMSLLWQHFGASQVKMDAAFAEFLKSGAVDVTNSVAPERRNRIQQILQHEKGLPISSFEMSQADRSRSRTGQGFVDLLEATYDNFVRVVSLRATASKLDALLKENEDSMDSEAKEMAQAEIKNKIRQSTRWTTNWGGAQQRKTLQEDGSIEDQDIWDQVSVPCGRITVKAPVFTQMIDPETTEPRYDGTGKPIMVRAQEPILDDDDQPIMANGKVVMRGASQTIEIDLWRQAGEASESASMAGEVDTTLGQSGNQAASSTAISSDDEF